MFSSRGRKLGTLGSCRVGTMFLVKLHEILLAASTASVTDHLQCLAEAA